jgi:Uma2 family endonuclease
MDGHTPREVALHPQPDWVPRMKIDVETYHRMAETGLLHPEDRVELIEGELIAMPAMASPRMLRVMVMTRLLVGLCGDRAMVSPQMSVRLGGFSEPEPDFALIHPDWAKAAAAGAKSPPKPEHIFLVIEVSDTSLRYDRTVKAGLYARYGVAEYWIVDMQGNAVIVHRAPREDGYAAVRQAAADEVLEPVLLPGLRIAVSDILA